MPMVLRKSVLRPVRNSLQPFTKELKRLRNIPLIVQIFAWYFVVPEFIPRCKDWMTTVEPVYAQLPTAFNKVCPEHKAPDGREKSPPELLRGDFFAFFLFGR